MQLICYVAPRIFNILNRYSLPDQPNTNAITLLSQALCKIASRKPETEVDVPTHERLGLRPMIMIFEFVEGKTLRHIPNDYSRLCHYISKLMKLLTILTVKKENIVCTPLERYFLLMYLASCIEYHRPSY